MTTPEAIRHLLIDGLIYRGSPSDLNDDFPLVDKHVIDSLGMMKLISLIEQEFGVKVDDDDVLPENFVSISAIARFVESKGAA
jgi:acyl carrier protein